MGGSTNTQEFPEGSAEANQQDSMRKFFRELVVRLSNDGFMGGSKLDESIERWVDHAMDIANRKPDEEIRDVSIKECTKRSPFSPVLEKKHPNAVWLHPDSYQVDERDEDTIYCPNCGLRWIDGLKA